MSTFSRADAVRALTDPTWREPLAWAVAIAVGRDPVAEAPAGESWLHAEGEWWSCWSHLGNGHVDVIGPPQAAALAVFPTSGLYITRMMLTTAPVGVVPTMADVLALRAGT